MPGPIVINEAVVIPASAITFAVARSGGPGGQNVNKVASKVDLRVDLLQITGLGDDARARLRALAGKRLDADGQLQMVSQLTRDQGKNLDDACAKVAAMVAAALVVPRRRKKTRPSRGSVERRLTEKKMTGARKRDRRRDD